MNYKFWSGWRVTLRIGEPLFADKKLDRSEAVVELRDRVHLAMLHLAGIPDEEENLELKKHYSYH
ncbi:MAG: hypothetical protein LKM30_03480 [Bacilli bacterium]|jgi:hypothetical protein|nr:hypothetical protein [Bacilli bacterium]